VRYPRTAAVLLAVSLACALGFWWGFREKLDFWYAIHFALLLHGALLSATLASALAWRHDSPWMRVTPRLVAASMALFWIHTWCEPLKRLVVWLSMARYLWLEI
jgi:hypothetical protein